MCAFHPFVSISHDDDDDVDDDMHNDALFSSKTHNTVALFLSRFLSPNLRAAALLLVLVLSELLLV